MSTPSGWKEIEIKQYEFVARTPIQFFSKIA